MALCRYVKPAIWRSTCLVGASYIYMSQTRTTSAKGAGMGTQMLLTEYVFYYTYVTRGLALFHGFIATLSKEKVT